MTSSHLPLRNDNYVHEKAFSTHANHVFATAVYRYPAIYHFESMISLIKKMPDLAHYSMKGTKQLLVQALAKYAPSK
jgi:hypothetical protein